MAAAARCPLLGWEHSSFYATFRVFEGGPFHPRSLPVAFLFTAPFWDRCTYRCPQLVRHAARLDSKQFHYTRCPHFMGTARISLYLLLLPRRVLQSVLGRIPPSCTVSEPRNNYRGEHSFPLIIQNIHRYFLYIAIIVVGILAYDVWKALWFDDGNGGTTFGIGVGTIILAGNVRPF